MRSASPLAGQTRIGARPCGNGTCLSLIDFGRQYKVTCAMASQKVTPKSSFHIRGPDGSDIMQRSLEDHLSFGIVDAKPQASHGDETEGHQHGARLTPGKPLPGLVLGPLWQMKGFESNGYLSFGIVDAKPQASHGDETEGHQHGARLTPGKPLPGLVLGPLWQMKGFESNGFCSFFLFLGGGYWLFLHLRGSGSTVEVSWHVLGTCSKRKP